MSQFSRRALLGASALSSLGFLLRPRNGWADDAPKVVEALPNAPVSLNSWLFDASMFEACERVPKSARGEYELPGAVQYAIDKLGARFGTFSVDESVLDLSHRTDIPAVAERLSHTRVEL